MQHAIFFIKFVLFSTVIRRGTEGFNFSLRLYPAEKESSIFGFQGDPEIPYLGGTS